MPNRLPNPAMDTSRAVQFRKMLPPLFLVARPNSFGAQAYDLNDPWAAYGNGNLCSHNAS